jgi:hypothetical protein
MERKRIIDVRPYPVLRQELPQSVSFRKTNHILVKDVSVFVLNHWKTKARDRREEILK